MTDKTEWLDERTILMAPTGSFAYGTNVESSDRDYKGICIPPIDCYLGLSSFKGYDNTGGNNFRNTKDDVDVTIQHLSKFVRGAMQGIPNDLEMLFVKPEEYLKLTELGQRLVENRHLFLSQQVFAKMGGYSSSQMNRAKKSAGMLTGRVELIAAHGWDTKYFMHAIRLMDQAIEILETGTFTTYRPNREFLLDCRTGKYSFDEAVQLFEEYDKKLRQAKETSVLPVQPDKEKINALLIDLTRTGLGL